MKYQHLNTDEMMALEKRAFENYLITLEQMMQKAGRAVFEVIVDNIIKTEGEDHNPRILIVVGKGNNGGDALVTARLLHEKGIPVTVLSPYPDEEFTEMAKKELKKVRSLNIPIHRRLDWPIEPADYSLIIDALFGFSLEGNPRPPADQIIEQILYSKIPVLAVDVPSGLDVHDGSVGTLTIRADFTVALGMLKKGFEEHPDLVGKVYLGDLGIPEKAYQEMGVEAPRFEGKAYLPLG